MMNNTVRAALVAGMVGSATLGVAGAAIATATPGGTPCASTHCYTAHAGRGGAPIVVRLVDDEDGGGDMGGGDFGGGDSGADFAPAETNDAPDTSWEPMDSGDNGQADSPADIPAEGPSDLGSEPAEPAPAPEPEPAPEPASEPADSGPAPAEPGPAADPIGSEPAEAGNGPVDEPAPAPAQDPAPQAGDSGGAGGGPADSTGDVPGSQDPAGAPHDEVTTASQQDIATALGSDPVTVDPAPAQTSEVTELRQSIESQWSSTSMSTSSWSSQVSTWNPGWVSYDAYYRPTILNPYTYPLQLIYTYADAPRIVTVPPLQRAVIGASNSGVTGFTAVAKSPTGGVTNVSVGSFTGGGHAPVPGQPPAQKPAPLTTFNNVLVQLRYSTGTTAPFRVKEIADLGNDASMGATKVLIDGATTAWGQWTKNSGGERLFAITKTEALPGLTAPSESPLPGYRDVRLTANTVQSDTWTDVLVWVAIGVGAVGVCSAGAAVVRSRRRNAAQ
jgi:hypothetical protein